MAVRKNRQAFIELKGCRENNLKALNLSIPTNKLTCVCGPSGSGKTSLVINTLYAEGQRRYIESFSTYARQYLERIDKPKVDSVKGLPPAISIRSASGQSGASRSNRVTVGSSSEVAEFLRLFFAEAAHLYCFKCGERVFIHTPEFVADEIAKIGDHRVMVGFEAAWQDATSRAHLLADLQADGLLRIIVAGNEYHLADDRSELVDLPTSGDAYVVVDRVKGGGDSSRLVEGVEECFQYGLGEVVLLIDSGEEDQEHALKFKGRLWKRIIFSDRLACSNCDIEYPQSQARLFSYNNSLGACPNCEGFGNTVDYDERRVVPDDGKSIEGGAVVPWNTPTYSHCLDELLDVSDDLRVPTDVPFRKLTKRQRRVVFSGDESVGFGGIDGFFRYLERKKYKLHVRVFLSRWKSYSECEECNGKRLNQQSLSYRLGPNSRNFADLSSLRIDSLAAELNELNVEARFAAPLQHLLARLQTLIDLGLGYLSLDRPMRTLSSGESQRVAISTVLGSSLVNVLYALDEPTNGLHCEDISRLSKALRRITERGNTVVVVDHHPQVVDESDTIIELGPGAGEEGGRIVKQVAKSKSARSQVAAKKASSLKGEAIELTSRQPVKDAVELRGCCKNNLKSIDVDIPLGLLCCVTGVSGSGKTSLVHHTLSAAVKSAIDGKGVPDSAELQRFKMPKWIRGLTVVDRQPIGKSPRSNPATFTKAFKEIRELFAGSVEARTYNMSPGHFSFNSPLGRCGHCGGDGTLEVDMHFLADVRSTCPVCHGSRFNQKVLRAKYRSRSIAEVLELSVAEAVDFFRGESSIQSLLKPLCQIGLGYLRLGQPAPTLSSGEGQRLKLAINLGSVGSKKELIVLDEPSNGLHRTDLGLLIKSVRGIVEQGASVVMIDHSLDMIASADYIIDLGPGPAEDGGQVVATGTVQEVCGIRRSVTGKYLREHCSEFKL